MTDALLNVRDLSVELPIEGRLQPVLRGVSLAIRAGEVVGLVGESGSGKSMTALAICRLLPRGAQVDGSITFDDRDVLEHGNSDLRRLRMNDIAIVFQDPRAHINAVRRIGDFLCESMRINLGFDRQTARLRALALLDDVGVGGGERRLRQYPHELSGGMLQRVMIAAALACNPRLLLADEPTTALDVTVQSEIMAILADLRRERGLAILFITHDLELAAAACDRICVMYAGRIVEDRTADALLARPLHPYTSALFASRPRLEGGSERLLAVPGRPVSAFEAPPGCAFAPRCPRAEIRCTERLPELVASSDGLVACLHPDGEGDRQVGR